MSATYNLSMEETRWWRYLSGLMGTDTATEAARRSGISSSNFTRWKKGARADPDFVVKVARAYDANVLEALVEAEFITDEEASLTEVAPDLDITKIPGNELMDELERRIEILRYLDSLDAPKDELAERRKKQSGYIAADAHHRGIVFAVPPETLTDEQREYLEKSNNPGTDIRTDGYDPLRHAGYSGPDEDAMRGYGKEDDDHIP